MDMLNALASGQGLLSLLAATPASGQAPAAAAEHASSMLDYIRAAGPVGYCLIALSIVALALAIATIMELRRGSMIPDGIVRDLQRMVVARDVPALVQACGRDEFSCAVSRVLEPALRRCAQSELGFLEARTALAESGQREMDRLARPIDGLALIAAVGPMLGLLGTVIGMIGAFATIGQMEGAARSMRLAEFMSMALVATAMGLIVAIPCTIAYALLKKRAEKLMGEVGEILEEWVPHIEKIGRLPAAAAGPAVPGGVALRGVRAP